MEFDWELYELEEQKFARDFDREYEKAWEVPSDVTFLGAPGYYFPATQHATKALSDFGNNLLTVCREILQSCTGVEISGLIRGKLLPRVLDAITSRHEKIRQHLTSMTYCHPDDLQMAVLCVDQKTDGLKKELRNELEIQSIKFAKQDPFAHSNDYRSVTIRGTRYTLTSRQAQIIEILHNAYKTGTPEVGNDYILAELESPSSRLRDSFKSNLKAWKVLVERGKKKGTVCLRV